MTCHQCESPLDVWVDVTYDTDSRRFCSLLCVYRYRGRRKLA